MIETGALVKAKIGNVDYYTLDGSEGAFANVKDGETINLLVSVTLDQNPFNVALENKAVTLDLGGKTLFGRTNLKSGSLTVQNGAIVCEDGQPLNVYGKATSAQNYSVLTVASNVTVSGEYGVCIFGPTFDSKPGYGAVANIAGKINATYPVFVSGNLGNNIAEDMKNVVNINSGAVLTSTTDVAVALNGWATVNVKSGATINGSTGIAVKRGVLNVEDGATVTANGEWTPSPAPNNNGTELTGAAVSMTPTYSQYGAMAVNITGGTFSATGTGSEALYKSNGTYQSDATFTVIGGTFSSNPSAYVADGYVANENTDGTWTVEQFVVAQIGTTKYSTLTAAFAAAKNGDTVTLLRDYDARDEQPSNDQSGDFSRMQITKSITIDGDNHTVILKGRGFAPGKNASSNIDVTFKDITILNASNAARCIDSRGHIGTLTLDNATLNTQGASGQYTQPLTIGGNQATAANVVIKNGSVIQTNDDATAYYAVITFNPVNMSITGSTITGWAAIYMKGQVSSEGSHGSIVNIENSTINSMNVYDGETNAFSAFVFEDNNITVNLTNSRINITAASNQQQGIASFIYQDYDVNPPADINTENNTVNLGDGNIVTMNGTNAVLALDHTETSKLYVTGGTFNVDPTDFCAPGYAATQTGTSTWTVAPISGVAAIGTQGYETLPEAVEAATDGQTVTLLSNIQTTAQIEVNKTMTLDLNGKTIQYTGTSTLPSGVIMVLRGANLTINDSGTTGAIVSGDNAYAAVALTKAGETSTADAQLTVNGGSLTGLYYAITGNGSRHGTVIEINGGTLTGTAENDNLAIFHPQDGTLTINGGTLTGYSTAVELRSGTLVINGGTFTSTAQTYSCNKNGSGTTTVGAAIAVVQHTTALPISATINGGTLSGVKKLAVANPENTAFDNVSVLIPTTLASSTETVVVPDSFGWKNNGDGTSALVKAVAKIGDDKYESLAEAVAAVPTDGTKTTIQMIADETMATEAKLTVAANQNIVLDLNGKTISGSHAANDASFYFITNKGTLEITDTSSGKNGKITASWSNANYSYECVTIYNLGGTLTLSAGKVETTSGGLGYAINNSSNAWGVGDDKESVFNMTGGTLNAPSGDAALRVYQNCGGYATPLSHNLVNISGGTIATGGIFLDETVYKDNANPVGDGILTDVTISGGEIHGLIDLKMRHSFNTTFHITGGTFVDAKLWIRKHSEWHASVAEPTAPIFFISGGNFSFVNNMAFGLEYNCDGTSWTSYTKPYSITGGTFNVDPSAFCALGYAATGTGPWTVASMTNWISYAASDAEFADATDGTEISISSAALLAKFAKNVNEGVSTYNGYTIKLTADIDLAGKNWTPVGVNEKNGDGIHEKTFEGTFDGANHTISNLYCYSTEDKPLGLFGISYVGPSYVKDLTLSNVYVNGVHQVGAIYGNSDNVHINNCKVVGGSVTTTPRLTSTGYDDGNQAGGIAGYVFAWEGEGSITNCTVENLTIKAYRDVGGVAGACQNGDRGSVSITGNTVKNCTVIADQTSDYNETKHFNASEIVGRKLAGTVESNTATTVNVQTIAHQ